MTLAVYRTLTTGRYFLAPRGLVWPEAEKQRVSPYYTNQLVALGALIEKQHDYNEVT